MHCLIPLINAFTPIVPGWQGQGGESPTAPATAPGAVESVQPTTTAPSLATEAVEQIAPTFTDTSLTGWAILFGGILAGIAAGRFASTILRGIAERWKQRGWPVSALILHHVAGPANLAFITAGVALGVQGIVLAEGIKSFVLKVVGLLYILAIAWFIFNLVDLVELALRRVTGKTHNVLDDTVVTLLRKTLRVFLLIVFALFVAENVFEQDITAWLAGLGIAGLAVSLAAQDSIKNLFGSITVLLDRPFSIGDRILFDKYDGVIETIGFRSSKLRTTAGNLVTVPNMRFTDSAIENMSTRPFFMRSINLQVTYDTSPQQLEQAVQIVKDVLAAPDIKPVIDIPDRPPRVFFNDFASAGLNIAVSYSYANNVNGQDWWTYQALNQTINLRILQALAQAGIELAFPTQTLFLAGDPKRELAVRVVQGHATNSAAAAAGAGR